MRTFVRVFLTSSFLAGFVAGEGHFSITENNAGQSWCCRFVLVQRDDNADLVAGARDLAGCGEVRWKRPHLTSHAQIHWVVQSMHDCSALARSLSSAPLLGKKAGDFRLWQRAVAVWNEAMQAARRWQRLAELASELRAHRDPSHRPDYTRVDISPKALAGFLAGFASAEAHFGATRIGHPTFVIKLRADDTAVLSLLAKAFGVGRLVPIPASDRGRPQTAWLVTRLPELRRLVCVFDAEPPLGRAGRVYRHWRQLVLATDRSASSLQPAVGRLLEARRYVAPRSVPVSAPRRASKQARYVALLQAWAREAPPPYTATSYMRWRSRAAPGAPTRNTLARFFGSWREALEASGLSADGSRLGEINARAVETAAAKRVAARSCRRTAVLCAVDRCWAALGRVPTASEFFRWRLTGAPDAPGQAAVYRLFPGGWPAVLEALPPKGRAVIASPPSDQPDEPPLQPLHIPAPARVDLTREPHVQPGSVDQVGHEGVAGHEVAAWQRQ
jgi:LAGLIDADG endonuclease